MLTLDEDRQHGLASGAFAYVNKPTSPNDLDAAFARIKEYTAPRRKRLLVVEDDPREQLSIQELLGYDDIDVQIASTGSEALGAVNDQAFDCVVLDLRLPDMSGFDVLERFRDTPSLNDLPVVVFTGKDLSPEEDARLHMLARSVVVKGVESPERLLDETALFLHRVVTDLPARKAEDARTLPPFGRRTGRQKRFWSWMMTSETFLRSAACWNAAVWRFLPPGRVAMRSPLSSQLRIWQSYWMDIMMTEMDRNETMQVIRQNPSFRRPSDRCLTAKVFAARWQIGKNCLEAGASEYLAKPVNTEQLLFGFSYMWFLR